MTIQEAFNIANQKYRAGRIAEAREICRNIVAVDPGQAEAWHLLGLTLYQGGDPAGAVEPIGRAVALMPGRMDFYYNHALVFDSIQRREESGAALLLAARSRATDADLLTQVGRALYFTGHPTEAIDCAKRLLEMRPDDAFSHWNYAILLLLHGRLAEGFREFEWRHSMGEYVPERRQPSPAWNGEPMPDGTLLVCSEGGLGDVLLFVRYVPMLVGKVGKVVLECQPSLFPLVENLAGVEQVIARGEFAPPVEGHVYLSSLPRVFGTDLATVPNQVPYLKVPARGVEKWAGRVICDGLLNVGLCWSGNREASPGDKRSVTLTQLAPLAGIPGVRYYSLQLGKDAGQTRPAGLEMVDFTADIHDFGDTAALVAQLDSVISVDTSVAHLAGALGKPVWVLVQFVPAYQWLLDRTDSPWYPTARIFRQTSLDDWPAAIAAVAEALKEKARTQAG